jgi:hypothetical protein
MKARIKRRWVKALRSGKYVQGHHALRTHDDKFCCLGVLCDIYDPKAWKQTDRGEHNRYSYLTAEIQLPSKVQKWADIDACGRLSENARRTLIHLNDDGMSFAEMADIIEENF